MIPDLDIFRSAQLIMKQHSEDAPIHAAMRADAMLEAHGGMDRCVLAVLFYEEVGAAKYVEVGDHLCCTRLTAASASAAVMSGRARWTA